MNQVSIVSFTEVSEWIAAFLAFIVSLLTLYNAAQLKTGMLAVATYAFGVGMLSLALGFLVLALPAWEGSDLASMIYHLLFIFGFTLLGYGSYRIHQMSRIK